MKHQLIMLATTGLATAAAAQSSVTLYGIADAGIGRVGYEGQNGVQMLANSYMNNLNSRIGVRGAEDLGGGLRAGFNFESGLDLKTGATDRDFWARQAILWIGGQWGTLTMGRLYNPSYDALYPWELTGSVNYSVVGDTYNYTGETTRTSSAFKYTSPTVSGLTGEVAYVANDNNVVDGQGRQKWDLGLWYDRGPVAAGLSINKTGGEKTNYTVGGQYRFGGAFAVAASYSHVRLDDGVGTQRLRSGFSIGARYQAGPFTTTLDLVRDTRNELAGRKYTNGVLEGKYALSKRTFVYAAYLRLDGTNNYGVGLQHSF